MNIKRKEIPFTIEGKEYGLILDFESAMEFQSIYGKSIFVGISKISEEQDMRALGCLIASCLKDKETNKAVGIDFVAKLDFMEHFELFISKLTELVDNSLPKDKNEAKKK